MKKMLGLMCTVHAAIGIYYLSYYNLIPQRLTLLKILVSKQ